MTDFERKYIDTSKEWILAKNNLFDAGYPYWKVDDLERRIDKGEIIKTENDAEKRLYDTYIAEKEIIRESVNIGYEMQETTKLFKTALKETKEGN